MKLSGAYQNMKKFAMVYHTQPNSEDVEFVRERFFYTEEKAWKWFDKNFTKKEFVQPECVEVSNIGNLNVSKLK